MHRNGSVMCPVHLGMCILFLARRKNPLNKFLVKCGTDLKYYPKHPYAPVQVPASCAVGLQLFDQVLASGM